ncbi:MAG TPA: AAA family ATPase [Miltoncostaeaceae bacterium]|jgi:aminoglycoside phosphotransferase family enzyme/predicted kinase|nr:AAA family ATPase [Miltoncostaeaceae bacterium]
MSGTAPAEVRETHISVVSMIGDRAYKLLKPVDLGFLDHRRREARLAACLQETEVNRRFAPDVYLGVLDVTRGDGTPIDHLIAMRRMPADRSLSRLLDDPGAERLVREVGRAVAALHDASPTGDAVSRAGLPGHVVGLWDEGLDALGRDAPGVVPAGQVARARALAHAYIRGRGPMFETRVEDGWIRDGHGDLLADDVYMLDDGPRILDCLAFAPRLRHGDVLLDVAFLAMDLEARGHAGLAAALIDEWSASLGETHPSSLLGHYVAYRAHVRSKVAALRAVQGRAGAAVMARRLHSLAVAHLERTRVRLILVGGPPGSGKSTLAAGLGRELGGRVLRSDVVRKQRERVPAGAGAPAPWEQGIYHPDVTGGVYQDLLARAAPALAHGETVVLDASWRSAGERDAARRVGARHGADMVELRCELPPEVADARMLERRRAGGDPSDAGPAVGRAMRAETDPWPEATAVGTLPPPGDVLDAALALIDGAGPPG